MPILERALAFGITGSGKSYQWLKMAERLLPTGSIFRCIDTDNDIDYMLQTQFPHLLPENGGNVLVCPAFDWPEYKIGVDWLKRKQRVKEKLSPVLLKDFVRPLKPNDWTIVDRADNAWSTVQNHFVENVFDEDAGDYFLEIRRQLQSGARKAKSGGTPVAEGLDGWKDWTVINKLYNDWIKPIVYQIPTHVYAATQVDKVDRGEKDAELQMMFGDIGVRPSGQKRLGGQMHSLFLFIPGKDEWFITTVKDRGGRSYFKKVKLIDFYMQYLVAKAGWIIP